MGDFGNGVGDMLDGANVGFCVFVGARVGFAVVVGTGEGTLGTGEGAGEGLAEGLVVLVGVGVGGMYTVGFGERVGLTVGEKDEDPTPYTTTLLLMYDPQTMPAAETLT